MDQFLADFYGTNQFPGQAAEMQKMASDGSEADFLGRVMAHSFHQERQLIKEAMPPSPSEIWESYGEGARGGVRKDVISGGVGQTGRPPVEGIGGGLGGRAPSEYQKLSPSAKKIGRARRLWEAITKTRGRKAALAIGGAAALAGAGYGGYRGVKAMREKKSSDEMFAELVEQRAYEHLEAAGLLDKTAGAEEDFETMVDRAALEVLEANGYPVEWY